MKYLLGLILSTSLFAQSGSYNVSLIQQPLPIPTSINGHYTGPAGFTTYYYAIANIYPGSKLGAFSNPIAISGTTLSGTVSLAWTNSPNAIGVIVLRLNSLSTPGTCNNCQVNSTTALISSITDTLANPIYNFTSLTYYVPATSLITLDNQTVDGAMIYDVRSTGGKFPIETLNGPALPSYCNVGDLFFLTTATAGSNFYGCTSPNTWTSQGSGGGGGSGNSPFIQTVTAVSSIAINHNLNTTTPGVWCYDGSGNLLGPLASTQVTSITANSTNQVTVTFSGSTTGKCVVTTGGIGATGATGANGTNGTNGTNGATGPTGPTGSGGGGTNYQTVQANGTAQTQQPILDLISGTNATVACANNSGATRTECTISSTASSASTDFTAGGVSLAANSGAYVNVYSYTAPILPVGQCYNISFDLGVPIGGAAANIRVMVDSTVIANPWIATGTSNYYLVQLDYCNNVGVQNAQTTYYLQPVFYGNSSYGVTSGYNLGGTGDIAALVIPSAVNWTSTHVITIQANPSGTAAASIIGAYAKIYPH